MLLPPMFTAVDHSLQCSLSFCLAIFGDETDTVKHFLLVDLFLYHCFVFGYSPSVVLLLQHGSQSSHALYSSAPCNFVLVPDILCFVLVMFVYWMKKVQFFCALADSTRLCYCVTSFYSSCSKLEPYRMLICAPVPCIYCTSWDPLLHHSLSTAFAGAGASLGAVAYMMLSRVGSSTTRCSVYVEGFLMFPTDTHLEAPNVYFECYFYFSWCFSLSHCFSLVFGF